MDRVNVYVFDYFKRHSEFQGLAELMRKKINSENALSPKIKLEEIVIQFESSLKGERTEIKAKNGLQPSDSDSTEDEEPKKKNPSVQKVASKPSARKESSDSDSTEDEEPKKKNLSVQKVATKAPARKESSDSDSTEDEEPKKKNPSVQKVASKAPARKESSDSDSTEDEEPKKKNPSVQKVASKPSARKESSDSDSTEDEEPKKKNPSVQKVATKAPARKESSDSDSTEDEEPKKKNPSVQKVASKASARKESSDSDSSEEEELQKRSQNTAEPPNMLHPHLLNARKRVRENSISEISIKKRKTRNSTLPSRENLLTSDEEHSVSSTSFVDDNCVGEKMDVSCPESNIIVSHSLQNRSENNIFSGGNHEISKSVPSTPLVKPDRKANERRRTNSPFRRVKANATIDEHFQKVNDYDYKGTYAEHAMDKLKHVKGKDFRREKNKKKRGGYKGGKIDFKVRSIIFDD